MAEDKKNKPKKAPQDKGPQDKPKTAKAASSAKPAAKTAKPAAKQAAAPKKEAKPAAKKSAKASFKPKPSKKKGGSPVKRAPLLKQTYFPKGDFPRGWRLVDADGQTLGRLSSRVAQILMGKDKASFTRFKDTGDFVVVINAEKIKLTGKKMTDKWYHYHTHFPGGIKSMRPIDLLEKHPERIIERAVYGMLPKGHMGRQWLKKLKIYAGEKHPHTAQKPQPVDWAKPKASSAAAAGDK